MACKNNQRKDTCSKSFAICVEYQGEIPEYSELVDETCVSVEETIDDLYISVGQIKTDTDLSAVTYCDTLPTDKTPKVLIQFMLDAICDLKTIITTQADTITVMRAQIEALQASECP